VTHRQKKRPRNRDFRVGYLRRYLCQIAEPSQKSQRLCGSCVFYHTKKCAKASAGHDLVLPTDHVCEDYEDYRKDRRRKGITKIPWLELPDGTLAEQCFDGTDVYFYIQKPDGTLEQCEFIPDPSNPQRRIEPVMNKDVKTLQVLLPTQPAEYGSTQDLLIQVKEFMDRWHEETDIRSRQLDALYALLTYLYPLPPQMPYRRYLARFGKGKSARTDVLGSICYRPFFLAGCDSEPSLRRTFDLWRGTAIIDEADFGRSDLYATIMKILNIGFDMQKGWYRCCDDRDPTKVLSFYVAGPKVIATRKRWNDVATESRCLTDFCEENVKPMPLYRAKKFFAEALELRNKLLMWRFKNYLPFKEKMAELEGTDIIKEIYGEDSKVSSRLKQVTLPLALIIEDQRIREIIKEVAVEHDELLKSMDYDAALEDALKTAIEDMVKVGKTVKVALGGKMLVFKLRDIAEKIAGTDDPDTLVGVSKSLSNLIRSRTKWRIKVGHGNLRQVHVPADIPGLHATLTDLTTLTHDLDLAEGDVEKAEVLFPSKVRVQVSEDYTRKIALLAKKEAEE